MRTRAVPTYEVAAKEMAGSALVRILNITDSAKGDDTYVSALESLTEQDVKDCMAAVVDYKLDYKLGFR